MSKAKHTPGPWKCTSFRGPASTPFDKTISGHNKKICIVEFWEHPGKEGLIEAEANAQLIADAPLLLEALTDVMDYIEKEMIMSGKDVLYFQAANRIVNKYKGETNE